MRNERPKCSLTRFANGVAIIGHAMTNAPILPPSLFDVLEDAPILARELLVGDVFPAPDENVVDAVNTPFLAADKELFAQSDLLVATQSDADDPADAVRTPLSASNLRPFDTIVSAPLTLAKYVNLADPVPPVKVLIVCDASEEPSLITTAIALALEALLVRDSAPAEKSITSSEPSNSTAGRPLRDTARNVGLDDPLPVAVIDVPGLPDHVDNAAPSATPVINRASSAICAPH